MDAYGVYETHIWAKIKAEHESFLDEIEFCRDIIVQAIQVAIVAEREACVALLEQQAQTLESQTELTPTTLGNIWRDVETRMSQSAVLHFAALLIQQRGG